MCRRNICSIPLELPVPLVLSLSLLRSLALFLSALAQPTLANGFPLATRTLSPLSLQCLPFPRISSYTVRPPRSPRLPSRHAPRRGYWTFRLHGRQVYFYSIRFIRLNMTCGYSPGDIFPILRDDIPTLVVPRVSCILCPYRSFSPRSLALAGDRGKIRTILSRIIVASGGFMGVYHLPFLARPVAAGSISEISRRYFPRLVKSFVRQKEWGRKKERGRREQGSSGEKTDAGAR